MASIELSEIKSHLRIDHNLDDELLESYARASIEVAENYIGKLFESDPERPDKPVTEFSQAVKIGCLMYIAHLYANREITTDAQLKEVPMSIGALWGAYREPSIH